MEKTKRKALLVYGIIIILLLVSAMLAYKSIEIYNSTSEIKQKIMQLSADLEETENSIQAYQNIYIVAKEKLDYLDNLSQIEQQDKETFFSNIIALENAILSGKSKAKIAYITVDDGPNSNSTELWLETLEKYDILATFFVNEKDDLLDEYTNMIDGCHSLGNHTANHVIFGNTGVYASSDNFISDVNKLDAFLVDNFNYHTRLLRFPGGSNEIKYLKQDKDEFTEKVFSAGYGYVDWNGSCGDGTRGQAPEAYYASALRNSAGKRIVVLLMHDDSLNTLAMVPQLIETMQKNGYIFLPLCYESCMVIKE